MSLARHALPLMLLLASSLATAADLTAAGRWTQVDDEDGKPRSIVRVEEVKGEWEGHIEQIFSRPEDPPDHICKLCTDSRKDQPIVGMKFINGLKRDGLHYGSGEILDPANGKVYRAKMTLSADGNTLEVRGYIGISLFGRSQTWKRAQ